MCLATLRKNLANWLNLATEQKPCSLPIYNFNFSSLFLTFYLLYYDTESPVFLPTHHSVLGHVGTDF